MASAGQATATLLESFAATSMGCSALLAALVQTWIMKGTAKALLGEIQLEARSRQALARSILPGSIQAHPSGIHLWLPLPPQWQPTAFSQALEWKTWVSASPQRMFLVCRRSRLRNQQLAAQLSASESLGTPPLYVGFNGTISAKPLRNRHLLCDRISACVRRRLLLTMAHPVRRDDVKTFD